MKILALILSVCMILILSGCVSPAMKHAKQGDAYLEQGQWDNAISEYSAALKLEPSLELEPSIVLGPKLARAYASRATAFYEGGNYDAAIADFRNAAQKDPKIEVGSKLVETYKARAALHNKNGEYDMAIADADMAVTHNSMDATALYLRGSAYIGKKSWDMAIADLSVAIGIDKNIDSNLKLAEAYLERAALLYAKGLNTEGTAYIDRVISYSNEALQRNPNSAIAYLRLGSAYTLLQKPELAIGSLNKAIESEPSLFQPYYWRGRVYYDMKRWDLAEADLKRAIELSNDPEKTKIAEFLLKEIASKQGK